jgi:uncharacterized membrane protein
MATVLRTLSQDEDSFRKGQTMANYEKSIDVNVPVRTAYNQWTQFEEFPRFMDGVESVHQLDDHTLRWKANVTGKTEEWTAHITEQEPDKRIAWTSTSGARNAGVVTFHRIDDNTTRVMFQIDYEPKGVVENVGDMLGMVERRMEGDLKKFKEFIESRGVESGAWRGDISEHRAGEHPTS